MDKKRLRNRKLPLIICAALFAGALLWNLLLGENGHQPDTSKASGTVVITEIMSNNRTYPELSGGPLDYVEIGNLTDRAVDISGY